MYRQFLPSIFVLIVSHIIIILLDILMVLLYTYVFDTYNHKTLYTSYLIVLLCMGFMFLCAIDILSIANIVTKYRSINNIIIRHVNAGGVPFD